MSAWEAILILAIINFTIISPDYEVSYIKVFKT